VLLPGTTLLLPPSAGVDPELDPEPWLPEPPITPDAGG
jgi:hypothetical protein